MLTPLHFIYLAVIVVVIVLMIMKHDVVAPCILGIFILGTAFSGGVIGGAQAVFNSMLYAMGDLGDIMLVIALMVAMLKSLEAMGADQMMIAPAAKLLKTPAWPSGSSRSSCMSAPPSSGPLPLPLWLALF